MPPRDISNKGWSYEVTWDVPPPAAGRYQAVASWQLKDSVTSEPLQTTVVMTVEQPNLYPQVAEGGLVGVAGIPLIAFSDLKNNNYTVDVTIKAEGYRSRQVQATIRKTVNSRFPTEFTPAALSDLPMQPT